MIHVKEKVRYVLNYLETFKAVHKNHPRTHSLPQNKKAVLMTAAYFKVSTAVAGTTIALHLPSFTKKGVFGIKLKK